MEVCNIAENPWCIRKEFFSFIRNVCIYWVTKFQSFTDRSFSTRNFLYIYVHLSIQLMTSIFYSLGTYRTNCHLFKLIGFIILNDKGWLRWKRDIWPAKLYCFNVFVIFISYFAFQCENNRALKLLQSFSCQLLLTK